ncbi:MAG: hypothetical protein IT461_12490 [Planctomycetes bacterium]|jgi:hypothetical protein|nr:hypothetical protein [Planctomycetota bacterium]
MAPAIIAAMPDPTFDPKTANRHFAIALNQRAFELIGKEVRSAADDDELLYAAYGSAWHWGKVGGEVEHARAEWLISRAHCVAGDPMGGLRHANRYMGLLEKHLEGEQFKAGSGFKDFDLAYGAEALARAYALLDKREESAQFQKLAKALGDAIADPEDKKIFSADFEHGPWNPTGERF